MKNILAFETVTNGKTYRHTRYSPDVTYGPDASWLPKGQAGCACDPDDPSVCFLCAGRKEDR